MNQFTFAIEELRERKRLTQTEMAELLGISRQAYNAKVKGGRNFTMEDMELAAEKTDTSLLVTYIDNKQIHFKEKGKKK